MQQSPGLLGDYVQTLSVMKADCVHKILYEGTLNREDLIGEARAYDKLLNQLLKNENNEP